MLETALLAFGVALLTSAAVVFLSAWEVRIRVGRIEMQLAEYEERLLRETKQRAAAASVAARGARLPNPVDEALIRQHAHADTEDGAPWWEHLVRK